MKNPELYTMEPLATKDVLDAPTVEDNTHNTKEVTHMKKEMFTDYSRLEIGLVDGDKVYCRKGNEVDVYKMFKRMEEAGEVAVIIDNGNVIHHTSNEAHLFEKKIYGAPANKKLSGYAIEDEKIAEENEELSKEREHLIEKEIHRQHLFDRMEYQKLHDYAAMSRNAKYHIRKGVSQFVTKSSSAAVRFIKKELKVDPAKAIIEINVGPDNDEKNEEKIREANDRVSSLKINGFVSKVNGHRYVYLFATASGARKNTILFIREDLYDRFMEWACCGLSLERLGDVPGKIEPRLGLLFSNSTPWSEVFGESIDLRRVAIVPDCIVTKSGVVNYLTLNGEYQRHVCRDIGLNITDGNGYNLKNDYTGLFRDAHQGKGLLVAAKRAVVKKLFGNVFKDYWGNERNIDDVDFIIPASCYKFVDKYRDWEEYFEAHERLGHEFCVSGHEEHNSLKDTSYQIGQTLFGDDDDVENMACRTANYLASFGESDNLPKLLPPEFGKALELCPNLLGHWYTEVQIQESYTSKRKDYLGGRMPRMGRYVFCATDPVAFFQHVFGHEVTGILNPGTVHYSGCKSGWLDLCRSPHLDHAHVIMYNMQIKDRSLFNDNVIYMPAYDLVSIRLRLDYDGDHLFVSTDHDLINLAKKTSSILKHSAIDWEAPKAYKAKWNKPTKAKFIDLRAEPCQIGPSANNLTKAWNWGQRWLDMQNMWHKINKKQLKTFRALPKRHNDSKKRRVTCSVYTLRYCNFKMFEELVAYYTMKANVYIDAAKHGGATIRDPKWIRRLMKDLPLPAFMEHAKDKTGKEIAYTGSFLDKYAREVGRKSPEVLEIEKADDVVFDPVLLATGPLKQIKDLCKQGKPVGDDEYENQGVFSAIAGRHSKEWKALHAEDDDNWMKGMENRKILALAEIQKYVEGLGYTLEDAYNAIVAHLFKPSAPNHTKPEAQQKALRYQKMMFHAFWDIFGEHVVEVLEAKKAAEANEKSAAEDCDANNLPF